MRILFLLCLLFTTSAQAAAPDSFLEAYRKFAASLQFTSRPEGVKALDAFLQAHYAPDAKLSMKQHTTWNFPDMPGKEFKGTGQATPASWKTAIGPVYEGQPLLFPSEGRVEQAEIQALRQSPTSLDTTERFLVSYTIMPGMAPFKATILNNCHYGFEGQNVKTQSCNAEITVAGR